jgi:hypothetical protein
MLLRHAPASLTLLALLLASSTARAAAPAAAAPSAPVPDARECATATPDPARLDEVRHALRGRLAAPQLLARGGTIRIAFHVITDASGEGNVSDAQIAGQVAELNRDYAGSGFRFQLVSTDRTANAAWFKMGPGTGKEKQCKQALAIDPAHTFNVYSCNPGHSLLGWAYFPFDAPEDHWIHGVVLHYASLPGGAFTHYNLGRTLTHESGHYLGLYHTFQGGCAAPGDEIDDTPFEASPATGCPEGRNTCTQPGDDPIHDYMDYTYDDCYTEFTSDQQARMAAMVAAYRPSLFGPAASAARSATSPLAAGGAAIRFHAGFPSTGASGTLLHFELPQSARVTLEVFDVAGQHVATLADGTYGAGAHAIPFGTSHTPAGMYFARLRSGSVTLRQSVLVLR